MGTRHESRRRHTVRAFVVFSVLASSLALAPSAVAAVTLNCPASVDVGSAATCSANADGGTPVSYEFSFGEQAPKVVTTSSSSASESSDPFNSVGDRQVSVEVTYAPIPQSDGTQVIPSPDTSPTRTVSVVQPNRAPEASLTCSLVPCDPISGQSFLLTASATDPDAGDTRSYSWDVADASCTGTGGDAERTCTFVTPGARTVSVTVTDSGGLEDKAELTVRVENRAPTAGFTNPRFGPGQQVTLTSTSSDPDGSITGHEWDLNGDGTYERNTGTTPRVTTTFFAPTTVRHRVRDNSGTFSPPFETRVVPNDTPPTPSFNFQPVPPGPGQQVTFYSTSADVEGAIVNYAWDLDGNGTFETDTGATPSVSHSFPRAGSYTVSLRVSDGSGQRAIATQAVTVNSTASVAAASAPPAVAAAAAARARLPLLRPFPVVRLRGTLTRTGARIRLLSVQAPRGARVTVRCKGRSCGKRRSQVLRSRSSRSLRFTRYHRHMRAGTVLQVFVSKPGSIGKYVRFTIRKRKPPLRRDSCVVATSRTPSRCPSG